MRTMVNNYYDLMTFGLGNQKFQDFGRQRETQAYFHAERGDRDGPRGIPRSTRFAHSERSGA